MNSRARVLGLRLVMEFLQFRFWSKADSRATVVYALVGKVM
jgi:hypothetical protein